MFTRDAAPPVGLFAWRRVLEDVVGGGRVRIGAAAPGDLMPGPVLAELAAEAEGGCAVR